MLTNFKLSMILCRLNTLERASVYEQTFSESWLDEGEYDDDLDIMDPTLGGDGGVKGMTAAERKEMTESEIGVSELEQAWREK